MFLLFASPSVPPPLSGPAAIAWRGKPAVVAGPPRTAAAFYPRLLRLRSGALLCGFDGPMEGRAVVKVTRQPRQGSQWEPPVVVSTESGAAANPQLAELRDGAVLCAYRVVDGTNRTIRTARSRDGGRSWAALSTIDTCPEGVWEPHLFVLPSGDLAVLYATERYRPQVVAMRRSLDGGATWGEEQIVASHPSSRDGMPVPALLPSGDILVVFEAQDYAGRPFVIRCTRSSDGGRTWSDRSLVYASEKPGKKAGAPFVAVLPTGELVVSFQTDEDKPRDGDAVCDMKTVVSTDGGRTWGPASAPFAVADGAACWGSLQVDDGFVLAAASVRRGADAPRIEARRGMVAR